MFSTTVCGCCCIGGGCCRQLGRLRPAALQVSLVSGGLNSHQTQPLARSCARRWRPRARCSRCTSSYSHAERGPVLEAYARQMVQAEELHAGEVDKMLRRPGVRRRLPFIPATRDDVRPTRPGDRRLRVQHGRRARLPPPPPPPRRPAGRRSQLAYRTHGYPEVAPSRHPRREARLPMATGPPSGDDREGATSGYP